MSNSIKFTQSGGKIEIGVSESDDTKFMTVYVKDNGVGMPSHILDKLFKIDKSISSKGTAGETGSGLGLILCKEFIEKHGGKIWVKSEVGQGSTFYFTMPIRIDD